MSVFIWAIMKRLRNADYHNVENTMVKSFGNSHLWLTEAMFDITAAWEFLHTNPGHSSHPSKTEHKRDEEIHADRKKCSGIKPTHASAGQQIVFNPIKRLWVKYHNTWNTEQAKRWWLMVTVTKLFLHYSSFTIIKQLSTPCNNDNHNNNNVISYLP